MSMPGRTWRRFAVWLVLGLLLSQWATASYVCPLATAAAGQTMAGMPGCDGSMPGAMDTEQPQLCKAHCEQGSQTVNLTPASEPSSSYSLWAVLDWHLPALQPARAAQHRAHVHLAPSPPGSPPIYLALRVLRN